MPLPPLTGLVPKDTLTPVGRLEAERVTLELNPFAGVSVMLDVPWLPAATVSEVGLADMLKDGCGEVEPVSAAMSPLLGLPHPVTRS